MRVVDMIFYWARTDPHRPAVLQPDMVTTFQGLADAIESISNRIAQLALDKHEPVAISIANPSVMLATAFALMRDGFTIAPVNRPLYPHLKPAGIGNLIYESEGLALSGGRNIRIDMSWLPATATSAARKTYRRQSAGDGHMIFFSSGTTGLPKKVVQTQDSWQHRILLSNNAMFATYDKALIVPGLAGAFGFWCAGEVLYAGKTACFSPFGDAALRMLDNHGIEVLFASIQQALSLAAIQEKGPRYPLAALRMLRCGGALVTPDGLQRLKTELCRNVVITYASTEAGIVAMAPHDAIADVPGAVGVVVPGAEIEIVDEAGHVLPAGATGIIRLRTPQLLANLDVDESITPGDRAGTCRPAGTWFYPGDVGRVTEDGVLCLAGRSSDVINRGGVKISATGIAAILEALPEIAEAAACGIEGASGLEEVWVAVVRRAPIDDAEIKRVLKDNPDIGIVVDEIFEVAKLPRGELGKIQKYRLKEILLSLKRGA